MSTVKVNEVRHLSNSGTANLVLDSNATTNLQATNTLGLSVVGTLNVSGVATFNGNSVVGNAASDTMLLTSTVSGFNNFSGFTGEIRMYAGNAAGDDPPDGWLYCNGDTISNTINDGGTNLGGTHYNADGKGNDYQPLFNLLKASSDWGNTSSASWGTDKVKVPDFRSRAPVGIATGAANAADARTTGVALPTGLTGRTLGDGTSIADGSTLVGKETHALTVAELASHTHATTAAASATGQSISTITAEQSGHYHTSAAHTHTGASHTHLGNPVQASLSQLNLAFGSSNYVHGGTGYSISTPGTAPGGQSSVRTASQSTTPGAGGSTTPGNTGTTDPAITVSGGALGGETHTHVMTTANTGSGTAHTILQPIIAVNYIIKV